METLYEKVLDRTFRVTAGNANYVYKTTNNTPLPLICKMYSAMDVSPVMHGDYIAPNAGLVQTHILVGDCQIFVCAATGGFVCAKVVVDAATDDKFKDYPDNKNLWGTLPVAANVLMVNSGQPGLIEPNDIGHFPGELKETMIPSDSGKFVVGAGSFDLPPPKKKQVLLIHEQYWKRSPESFVLGPNSTKSVALVITTGRTETTTSNEEIKANLGIDVSGGWGPVTASMSASLEYGASFNRVVSVSETSQLTVEEEHVNASADRQLLYVYWNLVDHYTFVDFDTKSLEKPPFTVLAVVESVQTPSLLGVYELSLSGRPAITAHESG